MNPYDEQLPLGVMQLVIIFKEPLSPAAENIGFRAAPAMQKKALHIEIRLGCRAQEEVPRLGETAAPEHVVHRFSVVADSPPPFCGGLNMAATGEP